MVKHKLREGEARLLAAMFDHLTLFEELAATNHTSVADEMNDAEEHGCETYGELLNKAVINSLNARDRTIITLHYGLPGDGKYYTYEEIARALNVTCAYIHEHEDIALKRIKQYMTELSDAETTATINELRNGADKSLLHANNARDKGQFVVEDIYTRRLEVLTNAINKLKIQQTIRKHRDGTEQS